MSLGSIAAILTIVFVCLKLSGVIAWSWWLVFLPIIVWLIVVLFVVVSVLVVATHKYREIDR